MEGQVWHEEEVKASAAQAWKLYGGLELAKLAEIVLNNFISRVDLLHGDGGVGTLLKLHFLPGPFSFFFSILYLIQIIINLNHFNCELPYEIQ